MLRLGDARALRWEATGRPVAALAALRAQAWEAEDGVVQALSGDDGWRDALDEGALHVYAWQGPRLVGAGRLHVYAGFEAIAYPRLREAAALARAAGLESEGGWAALSRLVVAPALQGQGLGSALRARRLQRFAALGGGLALQWTKRPRLIAWALRHGWVACGQMRADFSRAGQPERTTVLALQVSQAPMPIAAPSEPGVS